MRKEILSGRKIICQEKIDNITRNDSRSGGKRYCEEAGYGISR